jgi:phosphatidyl-myo-inositol alpha-mannosyltransferase
VDTGDSPTSPPLRVALVCPYSLSRPGGVQNQVVGLARALGARGHRVSVFAPLDDPEDAPDDIELVVTGRSVSLPANGSVAPVSVSIPAVLRARRTLQSEGFDVVHVHEPFAPGLPYGLLVGRRIPPLVATFHRSGSSTFYTVLGPVARHLARRFAVRCAVSESARSTASDALGGTYRVGFNGVEVDRYREVEPWPTDRPAILFLGRHEERKGLSVLLDAFGELHPVGCRSSGEVPVPPVLWIAGDGPLSESLRRTHPESPAVHWLGVLSESEKVRRLVAADILCAPSLGGESFGLVLLEAMAARTVAVASDIDGYRQAAGDNAVLVPPDDPRSLSEALSGVLATELAVVPGMTAGAADSRRRWLSAAAERADGWSMERLAGFYEHLYGSALVGPSP